MKDGRSDESTDAKKPEAGADKKGFDYSRAITPERARPDLIAGAILQGRLDTEHWLSAGLDADFQVMVDGQRVFTPLKLDKGVNVGVYAAADKLAVSGILPDGRAHRRRTRHRLRGGAELPGLRAGRGAAVHERGAARPWALAS
jgi:hypothetical protein